jgi:hypothetical protein
MKIVSAVIAACIAVVMTVNAFAGGHKEAMKDPKKMEAYLDKRLNKSTGMESQKKELGEAVAAIVKQMSPEKGDLDPEILGHYVNIAVRTMNHNSAYQHEFNDALVKMHLTAVSFAKDQGMYAELVENDVKTTKFMMMRIGAGIKMTGREDFALKAIFEQTTCFYQLVDDLVWNSPTSVTYTTPFGRVLKASQGVGIFKGLTEEEVHQNYIIPRYQRYAKILGVKIDVSPLGENGEVTVSLI